MKNNKTKLWFAALVLLAVSTAFAEPIKLDDVKVGSTVTREGISFGWGEHIPVPEGEWEVVMREEGEVKGFGFFEHDPRILILLLNKNKEAPLQITQIVTQFEFKLRNGATIDCPPKGSLYLISDRLGTDEGQNYQLCKLGYKSRAYIATFEFRSSNYTKLKREEINFLTDRFNNVNPVLNAFSLKSGYKRKYPLNYVFATRNDYSVSKIDEWLNINAQLIKEHYDGKQIVFTELN